MFLSKRVFLQISHTQMYFVGNSVDLWIAIDTTLEVRVRVRVKLEKREKSTDLRCLQSSLIKVKNLYFKKVQS